MNQEQPQAQAQAQAFPEEAPKTHISNKNLTKTHLQQKLQKHTFTQKTKKTQIYKKTVFYTPPKHHKAPNHEKRAILGMAKMSKMAISKSG